MNGKKARKLREVANKSTVGEKESKTKQYYRGLKALYKNGDIK